MVYSWLFSTAHKNVILIRFLFWIFVKIQTQIAECAMCQCYPICGVTLTFWYIEKKVKNFNYCYLSLLVRNVINKLNDSVMSYRSNKHHTWDNHFCNTQMVEMCQSYPTLPYDLKVRQRLTKEIKQSLISLLVYFYLHWKDKVTFLFCVCLFTRLLKRLPMAQSWWPFFLHYTNFSPSEYKIHITHMCRLYPCCYTNAFMWAQNNHIV